MRDSRAHIVPALAALFLCFDLSVSQQAAYPKEIRGYKVGRAVVEMKKAKKAPDALIRLGEARLARVTPLGISLEIPIVVAPVTQKGRVDFLLFEEMVVNGTSVQIDEYHRKFDLPNKNDLVLNEPLKFYVYVPNAMLAALSEWTDSKETWRITGRVYVFGKYKKFLFPFKRAIPVELDLMIHNPLRD
jgi:hypothetical protein